MSTMAVNKLDEILLNILIEKYACSLAIADGQGGKQLLLRFRDCHDINVFLNACKDTGIEIGPGELSKHISELMQNYTCISFGKLEMHGRWHTNDFFIGETIRLNLKNRGHIDLLKMDSRRWWIIPSKTNEFQSIEGQFAVLNDIIGPNITLRVDDCTLDIESVHVLIATEEFRQLDWVVYPFYYCASTPSDLDIEETLILPLFDEIKRCNTQLDFNRWKEIAASALQSGLDTKTVWYVTHTIARLHNKMYTWS